MQRLITPERVIQEAFLKGEYLPPERIPQGLILVAEERYLRPVLGQSLYRALLEGEYAAFRETYVEPPLAYGVKLLLLPELRIRVGACGVAEPSAEGWETVSEEGYKSLRAALKGQLETLLHRLERALQEGAQTGELPAYDPEENILNRCRIYGGLLQSR
uniref:hypothetical protein n=1 Tax=Alistipes sp. TaxID=1872444 RepID=UPI004057C752